MVGKYNEVARTSRPIFYEVVWNDDHFYIQSSWTAHVVYDAWKKIAHKNNKTVSISLSAVLSPYANKQYNAQQIVRLLNGCWDSDLIEKENIVLGETVEMYNRHKGGDYNYGFKRLSISRLNLNDEFRKAIEFTCKDISLMQLCFSAQAANVFNSAVNLMDETEVEGIELIQKHSRAIYKFMKREGAYNSKKHTRNRVRMSSVSGD